MIIAIDGPAGAGKSTVARAVAGALDATYLDSGAMYRAVALITLERGDHPQLIAELAEIGLGKEVTIDGRDVTGLIRTPEVSKMASRVAAEPEVRDALVEQQRRIMSDGGDWVAEGRDIGTVVAPEADLKVFLTASDDERARRRSEQLGLPLDEVLAEQAERDERDRMRDHSPLVAADDAIELDTTGLSVDQVIDRIVQLARERS